MKILKPACIILLLFLCSCDPMRYASVSVQYTPKSYFRSDTTVTVLVNHFPDADTNKKHRQDLKVSGYASVRYAETELNKLKHVRVINLTDSATFKINTDSVNALASKYHAHYVLALKSITENIDMSGTENSIAYYQANATVNYVLYEDNGLYSKKLNGTGSHNSEKYYAGLFGSLIIHPSHKWELEEMKKAVADATQNALIDYLPYTITHTRPIYHDDLLEPAAQQIMARNYEKADTLLTLLLNNRDKKIAGKAAYNLAVVYESVADINAAKEMANLSLQKFANIYAQQLLSDLNEE
ncbi:MAG: hypothetical protein JO080_03955 [Mucilaginibacter sp.]|nr:hypothetical protein [Mucilaginibacter sp.]